MDGSYRVKIGKTNLEKNVDAQRRFKFSLQFISGKKIADFGCGSGEFLKLARSRCDEIIGIELQQNYVDELNSIGIACTNKLDTINDGSLDCTFRST